MGWLGLRQTPQTVQSKSDTAAPCTTAPQHMVTRDFQTRPLLPGFTPLLCGHAGTSAQNRTLALHLPGSPLGLHTWSPPHCKPCRMSGEQVSLLCGALSPPPDVSLHHLSWCRQSTALLSEADATAGCHCLHFKIRKAWGDRKAEISATSYEELGFCFCWVFF